LANPKRKHSTRRRDLKRAHKKLTAPSIAKCKHCHSPVLPHRVCKVCGYYNGVQVMQPAGKAQ